MKIAVTSQGVDLNSAVDPRFGRARYILIVDSVSMDFEIIDNSDNVNAFKGAGISAATVLSEKGADVLLTGHCGPNAFKTAQTAGIKIINDVSGTVAEAVENYRIGKYTFADCPDVDGKW